jgi:hypothetical protein
VLAVIGTVLGMLIFWPVIGWFVTGCPMGLRGAAPEPPRKPIWPVNLAIAGSIAAFFIVLWALGALH